MKSINLYCIYQLYIIRKYAVLYLNIAKSKINMLNKYPCPIFKRRVLKIYRFGPY